MNQTAYRTRTNRESNDRDRNKSTRSTLASSESTPTRRSSNRENYGSYQRDSDKDYDRYQNRTPFYDDGYDDNYSSPAYTMRSGNYNAGKRSGLDDRNIFQRAGQRIREGWNELTGNDYRNRYENDYDQYDEDYDDYNREYNDDDDRYERNEARYDLSYPSRNNNGYSFERNGRRDYQREAERIDNRRNDRDYNSYRNDRSDRTVDRRRDNSSGDNNYSNNYSRNDYDYNDRDRWYNQRNTRSDIHDGDYYRGYREFRNGRNADRWNGKFEW